MKRTCEVCENCLADGVITLATHSYDSDARRNIAICEACVPMIQSVHERHPETISEPVERPDFNPAD